MASEDGRHSDRVTNVISPVNKVCTMQLHSRIIISEVICHYMHNLGDIIIEGHSSTINIIYLYPLPDIHVYIRVLYGTTFHLPHKSMLLTQVVANSANLHFPWHILCHTLLFAVTNV